MSVAFEDPVAALREFLRRSECIKAFDLARTEVARDPGNVPLRHGGVLALARMGALEQAQRLKRLIEDLLSLSKLESLPLTKNHIEKIDIAMLVRESVEMLKSSDLFKNQQFSLNMNEGIYINGDYCELESAIQNVMDNAVKYSPEDSQIEISWDKASEGGSLLAITDHGEGIDQVHIPRLTERFYRIDKGRSRDMGGTGLGLSIVKHVMERHGGELKIRSQKEQGTRVELYFPEKRNVYKEQLVSA